jgi:hypothetical protein
MPEEKKGHVKITVEVEVNEQLMDMMKEAIAKMPEMMRRRREERQ